MTDKLICQGIRCKTKIGIKAEEKNFKQELRIDFEAEVEPFSKKDVDKMESIRIDYFEAYSLIKKFLEDKNYNLIEAVAQDIADLLLEHFSIQGIHVRVHKKPVDMPDSDGVIYSCKRIRSL